MGLLFDPPNQLDCTEMARTSVFLPLSQKYDIGCDSVYALPIVAQQKISGVALVNSYGSTDTRLPMTIDDNELSPDMQELLMAKAKSIEITFSLAMVETAQGLKRLYRTPVASFNNAPSGLCKYQTMNGLLKH
jgi:hypothetical protein